MKKLTLTIAIFLGLSLATFADGGGLFNRGYNAKNGSSGYIYFGADDMVNREGEAFAPMLPNHGESGNQPAPVGSGMAVLVVLSGAYLFGKRRKQ